MSDFLGHIRKSIPGSVQTKDDDFPFVYIQEESTKLTIVLGPSVPNSNILFEIRNIFHGDSDLLVHKELVRGITNENYKTITTDILKIISDI